MTHMESDVTNSEPDKNKRQLSEDEVLDLSRYLSTVAASGVPIAAGLRAMSVDVASRRPSRILRTMSERLDRGESLEAVLGDPRLPLPRYLKGIIAGSLQSGKLGFALERFIANVQRTSDLRRRCWLAVSYPLLLLFLMGAIWAGINLIVVPQFRYLYADFGIELPSLTLVLLGQADLFADFWLPVSIAIVVLALVLTIMTQISTAKGFVKSIPLIGPLVHWTSLSECYGYLSIYVEEQLPLPLAVQLTADAIRDYDLRKALRRTVKDLQNGVRFSDSIHHRIPQGLWSVIAWGEKHEGLSGTLEISSEIAGQRAIAQSEMIRIAIPPLLLVPTAFGIILCSLGMFLPLVGLLNALGSG